LVHPINTEAVVYITSRSDLLLTTFLLLSFLCLLIWEEEGKFKFILFSYLSSLLAFLTKETAIAIPVFFGLYFWQRGRLKGRLRYYFPYALMAILYILLRQVLYGKISGAYLRSHWLNTLTQAKVSLFYLRLFLFPHPLSIDHQDLTVKLPNDLLGFISLTLISSLLLICCLHRGRKFFIFKLGFLWYVSFLLPKYLAQLNFVAMEHHFYPAEMGLYFMIPPFFLWLHTRQRKLFVYLNCLIIFTFSLLTFIRNFEWKDEATIWRSAYIQNPKSIYALGGLAQYYAKLGLYNEAVTYYRRALMLCKDGNKSLNMLVRLAEVYRRMGELKVAENLIKMVFKFTDRNPRAYHVLGLIYLEEGNLDEAQMCWRKQLELSPFHDKAYFNIGLIYIKREDFKHAKGYFEKALEFNPKFGEAYFYLGVISEKEGDLKQAISYYEKAIHYAPYHYGACYNLATLYAKRGDPRAISLFRKAIEIDPTNPLAYYNLGLFYLSMEAPKIKQARKFIGKAEKLGYEVPDGVKEILASFKEQ
jgi:tetratricopeptide (TPR) repeat protein